MTRLLVSVRSAAEAAAALAGGADIIDVKEPSRGSLGAASVTCWKAIAAIVAGQVPLSAALGELLSADARSAPQVPAGYQFAKFGLAGCRHLADWPARWRAACEELPGGVRPVAVAYADAAAAESPDPLAIVQLGARLGCAALLVDTHQKQAGDLLAHWSLAQLQEVVAAARQQGLLAVLGGSLTKDSLAAALTARPDVIAVRGAVCEGDRTGVLRGELVAALAASLASQDVGGVVDAPLARRSFAPGKDA